jgi:hypothetical protein
MNGLRHPPEGPARPAGWSAVRYELSRTVPNAKPRTQSSRPAGLLAWPMARWSMASTVTLPSRLCSRAQAARAYIGVITAVQVATALAGRPGEH